MDIIRGADQGRIMAAKWSEQIAPDGMKLVDARKLVDGAQRSSADQDASAHN